MTRDRAVKVMSRQEINPTLGRSGVTLELHRGWRVLKGHRKLEAKELLSETVLLTCRSSEVMQFYVKT